MPQKPIPQAITFKINKYAYFLERLDINSVASSLDLGAITLMNPWESVKNCFFLICDCFVDLMDVSPISLQRQMFWGLISRVEVLKLLHQICRLNPSLLREKLRIASSHLSCVSLSWRWGLWEDCVSAPSTYFDMGFFLICQICRGHSASFWVSFSGTCSLGSCRFGISVGGEFGNLL